MAPTCVSRWGLGRLTPAGGRYGPYESYELQGCRPHHVSVHGFDRRTPRDERKHLFQAYGGAAVGTPAPRMSLYVSVLKLSELAFNGLGLCGSRAFWQRPDDVQHQRRKFHDGRGGTGFAWLYALADRLGDRGLSRRAPADGVDYAEPKARAKMWKTKSPGHSAYQASLGSGKHVGSAIEPIRRLRTMPARRRFSGFAWMLCQSLGHIRQIPSRTPCSTPIRNFAGNGAFDISATGKVLALGFPIHNPLETTHFPTDAFNWRIAISMPLTGKPERQRDNGG